MPHGIYVRLRPSHVAFNIGYDTPHGTYVSPCHVAFKKGIGHAHMLGLGHAMWHIG